MSTKDALKQYLENYTDEMNSAEIYSAISTFEKNSQLAELYQRLAKTEEGHARVWKEKLESAGMVLPEFRPAWRTRTLIWLAKHFGANYALPSLTLMEDSGSSGYAQQTEASPALAATEQSHARLLRQIGSTSGTGMEGTTIAQFEGRHRSAGGNALRAAVLGANDGLVSNFSLVMGVAGAEVAGKTILLTGLAGLLAGAISMALGEWISVQSSRELYLKQIRTEQEEILSAPEEETEELALIYQSRGLEAEPARRLAKQIMSNRESALETLSRDELGIDPEELGGSAWEAALTSFLLFAIGAIIPVIPFIFTSGFNAVWISALFSAIGLFIIGAAITLFTGRTILSSGLRQVIFGLAAAAVTYLIGRLIGVSVGG